MNLRLLAQFPLDEALLYISRLPRQKFSGPGVLQRIFFPANSASLMLRAVVAALSIRMILVAVIFQDLPDPVRDHELFGQEVGWIARSIALKQAFSSPFVAFTGPTALLPPLYPYLLSVVFRIFGVYSAASAFTILSLNSVFSALTCIPIYMVVRHSLPAGTAALAAWAWAVHPFGIYFSAGRVWEYALTCLLFTTCFCCAQRLHACSRPMLWLAFGLLYGAAALSNPSVLSIFPLLLLMAMIRLRRRGGRWLRGGFLVSLGVLAVVTPWSIRNYRALHVVCPVRDNFWEELWAGNTGDTSNPMPGWTHPASNPRELQLYRDLGEIAYIEQKRGMAVEFVSHHPDLFARLTVRRAIYYWTGFWSLDPAYSRSEPFQLPNVFFCTGMTLLMLRGAGRWWRAEPRAVLPYLALIAVFPLSYFISHPLMDYRQPIEPLILILATVGVFGLDKARSGSGGDARGDAGRRGAGVNRRQVGL